MTRKRAYNFQLQGKSDNAKVIVRIGRMCLKVLIRERTKLIESKIAHLQSTLLIKNNPYTFTKRHIAVERKHF